MFLRAVLRRACASAGVLSLVLAAAPAPCGASPRAVADGAVPRLAADEGLLVVATDTNVALERLTLDGPDGAPALRVARAPAGRSVRLFVAREGAYRFGALALDGVRGRHMIEGAAFRVAAGRVNYPGDVVARVDDRSEPRVYAANRALGALDALTRRHAALVARYPFAYAGADPDAFPALYRAQDLARVARPARAAGSTELPPIARALWRPSRLRAVAINPRGDLLAKTTFDGRAWRLELVDVARADTTTLAAGGAPIAALAWSGDRRLVVSENDGGPGLRVRVLALGDRDGRWHARERVVPRSGEVVDALPFDPDHVLFATRDPRGRLLVHRLDVSSQAALDRARFDPRERLNAGADADLAWFTDARGELRVALAARDDKRVLLHGSAGRWLPVLELAGDDDFVPSAVSPRGDLIYGLTDRDRGQRDLVAFDPVTRTIRRTLFSRPGVDVAAPLFDARRALIGAAYYREGRLVSEYFDAAQRALGARLDAAFPDRSVGVLDRDASGTKLVVAVDGSDHPTALYLHDATSGATRLVDRGMPWLADAPLARSQVVRTTSRDGFALHGILTLPAARPPGRVPLVVLPHGGPVGVSDKRQFDPDVQLIAALGYAVLQVNFRGSEHYGRAFREAGYGAYGTGIEDDVDAVLEAALAAHPLRRDRVCSLGTSYGGYSSLIAAVRRPERYRCVVSISGFTDRGLFFSASDTGRTDAGRALLLRLLGDPVRHADANRTLSPVYRAADLSTPVLLAHGTDDVRVDVEHTRRLARALAAQGRPPVVIELDGEGHTIRSPASRERLWRGVAAFLREHLGDAATRARARSGTIRSATKRAEAAHGRDADLAGHEA
jgi:dipeptidyl aminopeptidase/acylaminoacyl peptidase